MRWVIIAGVGGLLYHSSASSMFMVGALVLLRNEALDYSQFPWIFAGVLQEMLSIYLLIPKGSVCALCLTVRNL